MVFSLIPSLINACPFIITNDGVVDIVLIEYDAPEKKYYIGVDETINIPGAAPETYVWVYAQDKVGSSKFNLKYGIIERECIKEGDPLPHIYFSEFRAKPEKEKPEIEEPSTDGEGELIEQGIARYIKIELFDDILRENLDAHPEFANVKREIIERRTQAASLLRFGVSSIVKLIDEGKLTIEQLKEKFPAELVETVEDYLKRR